MILSTKARKPVSPTATKILKAAKTRLTQDGFAGLSTRKVAEEAGVPLSQIHYHFGSKQELLLGLLRTENEQLLERQTEMFGRDLPLWKRWEQACDYLDDDLASGYVRLLQEMIAAGWSSPEIATEVRRLLAEWTRLLIGIARQTEQRLGGLGPFSATEVGTLIVAAFIGAEATYLLGLDQGEYPVREALRKFGHAIKDIEEGAAW